MSITNDFGIPDNVLRDILDYFTEAVMETETPEDLRKLLGIDAASKKSRFQVVGKEEVRLQNFQQTLLKIASRIGLMSKCIEHIVKVQIDSPEVAQDLMQSYRSLLDGSDYQVGMQRLVNVYQDQLEVYVTFRDQPDEEGDEEVDDWAENSPDVMPKQKYDPFKYE